MQDKTRLVLCGAALMMLAGVASAGTVSYGALAAPGTYLGSDTSPNAGWTIDTASNGLELGLAAIIRFVGPATQDNSDYTVPTGDASDGASAWGVEFSVNTQAGSGTTTVSNYNYLLTVTDLTTPATFSFDPSLIPDNAVNGVIGFQNAEAASFSPPAFNYNPNALDTYQVVLTATPTAGGSSESVAIDISVTPEPGTWALIGSGMLCLLALRRRSVARRA